MSVVIRPPVIADVEAVAQVHVETWRETYRGLMPDELLDSPDMMGKRRRMWSSLITPENHPDHVSAIADQDGAIVGIALSGPSEAEDRPGDRQLFVLYAYAAVHGWGIGQQLLDAVVSRSERTSLWVADPNPRAQAFYRRNGFDFDGAVETDEYDGVRELRMVREPAEAL
ncbi:GNAT family N-acetyltransferase [Brevibacterium sp. UCMA 11752]|uniref:GNAT family N-acetyltransferase n=1 Tax=Brevibacterium sp. UCMA 11752 TaxID=2745946 RepID=UPI001F2EA23E|nr:GNAT family N-acetyltransferase [Brevibacterium sp. UCMA 11752]MCF2586894.1 GNAT family N-acetyltransferase [Brevibacterium sp. UCMA 11752]